MSLFPQTMRVRHRLERWTKEKRKHWDLYRWLMDPHLLLDALQLVMANDGNPGVDGETCRSIRGREWEYVSELAQSLRDRSYRPTAVRRVEIPKASGGTRMLGIPTVKDRVVQRALVLLLEPIYEQKFLSCSYGFRRGRSAMECAVEASGAMYRRRYVLEADIERFFDTVSHRKLLGMVRQEVVDPRVLKLIAGFLQSGCLSEVGDWEATQQGTPQGGPLSPLLANLYLHYALDERFERTVQSGGHTKLFRYCDDFIVVTDSPARLKSVRRALYTWMKEAGLKLKETKTREVDMGNEKRGRQSSLDFLGYRFHLRAFRDNPKRFWIARQPSEKARVALRRNLREKLRPTLSLAEATKTAKAVWLGWCGYFRYGNANHVLYREVHSVRKEMFKYLRRKYRNQRRPVPWKRLLPLGKQLMKGLRPVSVISGHPQQGRTIAFA